MPSQFYSVKRASWLAQKRVSRGAGITLVAGCGEYHSSFDCATHAASVLGTRDLRDLGDGILEYIPTYSIAFDDLFSALEKLRKKFSIALVDLAHVSNEIQFVLLARIDPIAEKQIYSLDDF